LWEKVLWDVLWTVQAHCGCIGGRRPEECRFGALSVAGRGRALEGVDVLALLEIVTEDIWDSIDFQRQLRRVRTK